MHNGMKKIIVLLAVLAGALAARAALHTQAVAYKQGDAMLEGWLAYDDSFAGKRPGVLVVHQWKGLGEYEKKRAAMLAQLGYVAFCADIYGQGIRPQTTAEAGAQAGKYKGDRQLLRARAKAGLDTLKKLEQVDTKQVSAIGYCFGGTTVIELARSGAELSGVVSFHGGLDSPTPADGKNIRCKVLACHGADDPFVPAKDLAAFEDEMRSAKVDWQLMKFGGAVHSFTDWSMDGKALPGAQYNEAADKRSWAAMQQFFGEIFQSSPGANMPAPTNLRGGVSPN